jgi:hypothetical protein
MSFWTEVEWGDIELAPPFLTYESGVRVYVDDLACGVRHVGTPAHTTNDQIFWVQLPAAYTQDREVSHLRAVPRV